MYGDRGTADHALLLLGIATLDPSDCGQSDPYRLLLLEPWAVKLAFDRGARPEAHSLIYLRERTRDAGSIAWPEPVTRG